MKHKKLKQNKKKVLWWILTNKNNLYLWAEAVALPEFIFVCSMEKTITGVHYFSFLFLKKLHRHLLKH
jgi:hypothetical protein